MVKHWFRNTLFKERQRNKDSPYNFNNPPSTTLNLEEYERTGQAKVTNLNDSNNDKDTNSNHNTNNLMNLSQQLNRKQQSQAPQPAPAQSPPATAPQLHPNLAQSGSNSFSLQQQQQLSQQLAQSFQQSNAQQQPPPSLSDSRPTSQPSSVASNDRADLTIKSEPLDELMQSEMDAKSQEQQSSLEYELQQYRQQQANQQQREQQANQQLFFNNFETKSESGSSDILSRPQTPNSLYNNINDIINQQIESIPINNITNLNSLNQMGPPKKFQLNKIFDKSYESNSNSSNSSTSSGKRANRTRFTDYQIKVLQEFFENNSYPKDSDLEYLSKLLLLSPRVIVVWFQVSPSAESMKFYEAEEKKTKK